MSNVLVHYKFHVHILYKNNEMLTDETHVIVTCEQKTKQSKNVANLCKEKARNKKVTQNII